MILIGILYYIIALFTGILGNYELTNYYKSYVGGDAYNYIIGGTHATAYFVLAIGFMICGTLFICFGILNGKLEYKKKKTKDENLTSTETIK